MPSKRSPEPSHHQSLDVKARFPEKNLFAFLWVTNLPAPGAAQQQLWRSSCCSPWGTGSSCGSTLGLPGTAQLRKESTSGTQELQGAGLAPQGHPVTTLWQVASSQEQAGLAEVPMEAQHKSQGARGLWAQGKAAHSGTGGTGISVLPHWHSIPREDFPHQLQPQQEPGLDFTSSLP